MKVKRSGGAGKGEAEEVDDDRDADADEDDDEDSEHKADADDLGEYNAMHMIYVLTTSSTENDVVTITPTTNGIA